MMLADYVAHNIVGYAGDDPPGGETTPSVTSLLGFAGFAETAAPRKHLPWVSFSDSVNKGSDFSYWPTDFAALPAVSFVTPDETHNMHDGTIAQADTWLQTNLDPYIQWCKTNNSTFFLWFDEDDTTGGNIVPAVAVGAGITAGSTNSTAYNHYSLLRTMETAFGASLLGSAATATPIPLGIARPDHIVICLMENHTYAQVIGSVSAPYINSLVSQGRNFTSFSSLMHPSEPNYFALFTGSTQGIIDDGIYNLTAPSLGGQLTYAFRNAEAAAYVARMTTPPNDYRRKLIDNLFTALKADGTYSTIDVLHLSASHSTQSALLNAVSTSFNGTVNGVPTFTVDRGYTTTTTVANGAAPIDWIDTGYDLSLQVAAGQNNASLSVWTNDTNFFAGSTINYIAGAGNLYLARETSTTMRSRTTSATSAIYTSATANSGLVSAIRAASGAVDFYHNGAEHATAATASASTPGTISYVGVPNVSTTASKFSTSQVAAVVIGQARTAAQELTLYNALHAYFQGVKAAV